MATIKGILSFSSVFTAKVPKAGGDAKFTCAVLLPANDPQIQALLAEVNAAKANTFPSGFPANGNLCFDLYEKKIESSKDYYDPRFAGWYMFTCSAKAEDRPAVVGMDHQPVIDPASLYSGMVVHVNAAISGYTKGTGGVGGWLNGIMRTDEDMPMGRLDGKPSIEQMFANVGAPAAQAQTAAPGAAAPAPVLSPTAVAPATDAPVYQMTEKAGGSTREALLGNGKGWTDELLISQGMMLPPGNVKPSFM